MNYKIRLAGLSVWHHYHSTDYKSTKAVKRLSDSAFLFKIDKDDISKVKNNIKMIDDESTSTEKWLTQGRHRQKRTTKALNFLFEWMKMKRFHRHIKYPGLSVTRESSQQYWWFRVKIRKLSERINTLSHRIWLKTGFLRTSRWRHSHVLLQFRRARSEMIQLPIILMRTSLTFILSAVPLGALTRKFSQN